MDKLKLYIRVLVILTLTSLSGWDLDKKVSKEEGGWIGEHYDMPKYVFVGVIGMTVYEGTESRLGRTSWQSIDAAVMSQIITGALKDTTQRNRPRESEGPTEWGEGGQSFVSGHVSGMTAMVTPYILEYKDDKPWVQVLWLLPIHQMIGRVKDQAHWQSDVIAGALVGYASGYWAHNRKTPMMLYFDDDKVVVGLKYKF